MFETYSLTIPKNNLNQLEKNINNKQKFLCGLQGTIFVFLNFKHWSFKIVFK